ncbi:chromosome segregation protein, partial [Halobacteriales archaeon SW_7_68_16]
MRRGRRRRRGRSDVHGGVPVRFERIALRNFRPYADVDLALDRGVTVVHGVNGSGKSSLLGACFFALYGSKALDDATLDDLVTTGEEEAEIDLQFVHAGGGYHVHRRLRRRGDRTTTVDCTMETPDGVIEGARDVRRYVTDMLRMDADAFVNCAYVRQGEVNKLIHATPSERQDTVDDLLQLGTLEEYRDRAGEARLAVKSVLAGQQERLAGLDDQIADKEAADLHDRLDAVRSERSEVEAEIERFEENEREARETLSEAEDRLAEYEDRREDLSEVEAEIEGVRERIAETEGEREELAGTIDDAIGHRDERRDERDDLLSAIELDADDPDPETVEGRIATLREDDEALRDEIEDATARVTEATTTAETARDRATELDAEADRLREEAVTAADRIDEIEATIEDRRERLTESRARRDDLRARFEDATVETVDTAVEFGVAAAVLDALADERESVVETLTDRRAEREAVSDRIERAEALLDEGKCPRCGQPVDGSPHVESVEDDRERHATLADECETLVERRETIDAEIDRVETLREAEREVDRIEDEIETVEDRIEEA